MIHVDDALDALKRITRSDDECEVRCGLFIWRMVETPRTVSPSDIVYGPNGRALGLALRFAHSGERVWIAVRGGGASTPTDV